MFEVCHLLLSRNNKSNVDGLSSFFDNLQTHGANKKHKSGVYSVAFVSVSMQ